MSIYILIFLILFFFERPLNHLFSTSMSPFQYLQYLSRISQNLTARLGIISVVLINIF